MQTVLTIFTLLSLQKKYFIIMAIEIGQTAPDFSLFDTTKTKVTLSELKGKNVLLLFFPQAFTSVCTAELCSTRDNIDDHFLI